MADPSDAPSPPPGPLWWWLVAWSLQGVGVIGVGALALESAIARFLLMGALAAVPLAGLYVILRNRERP